MFKYTLPSNPLEAGVCSHENPITENALSVSQSCPQQGPPGQPGIPGTPGTLGIPGTMGTLGSSMGCSCVTGRTEYDVYTLLPCEGGNNALGHLIKERMAGTVEKYM